VNSRGTSKALLIKNVGTYPPNHMASHTISNSSEPLMSSSQIHPQSSVFHFKLIISLCIVHSVCVKCHQIVCYQP